MAEGTLSLDLLPKHGEQLRRHPHDRHVADDDRLDRRRPRLSLMGGDLGPLHPEHLGRRVGFSHSPHSLGAVAHHRLFLGRFIEPADAELKRLLDRGQAVDRPRHRIRTGAAHGGFESDDRLVDPDGEVVGRSRSALKEEMDPPFLAFELLSGQTVEGRRAFPGLASPDGVGGMVEERCHWLAFRRLERHHRELRIERTGGTDGIVAFPDPEDRAVAEQEPAVLADARLLAEPVAEAAIGMGGEIGVGSDDRVTDCLGEPGHEAIVAFAGVGANRRGRCMGVGGMDKDTLGGNARGSPDAFERRIDEIGLDDDHVAGADRELLSAAGKDDRRGPQRRLGTGGLPGMDPTGHVHRVVGRDLDRRTPDPEGLGGSGHVRQPHRKKQPRQPPHDHESRSPLDGHGYPSGRQAAADHYRLKHRSPHVTPIIPLPVPSRPTAPSAGPAGEIVPTNRHPEGCRPALKACPSAMARHHDASPFIATPSPLPGLLPQLLLQLLLEPSELAHGRRHHPFAGARLAVAVVAGPCLVTTEFVPSRIGNVADPVVGELRDDGVAEGALSLDLHAEHGEQLRRHPHDGHIADGERLDRCRPRLSLMGGDLGPLRAEDFGRRVGFPDGPHPLRAVAHDCFLLG